MTQRLQTVIVNDSVQSDYSYTTNALIGQGFDPEFRPELTPKEMLELGVFGGIYFDNEHDEFPPEWFEHAKLSDHGCDKELNYFQIKASQPRSEWKKKGWIYFEDPRGWFQWYCRYYLSRRISEEDKRQIKRWKAIKRHAAQIQVFCQPRDETCRPRQRQALLHWAYDSRKL